MHMPLTQEWLDRLKLGPRVGKELITEAAQAKGHPYGEAIRKALDAGASGVFCLNNSPCAAVVLPPREPDPCWLQELYTNLWNQGELDFLLLLHPDRVDIHTMDVDPRTLGASSDSFLSTILDVLRQAGEIEAIITGLESGRLLKKKKGGLNTEAKVDASLIRDLEGARKTILATEGFSSSSQAPKELIEQIHDVMLQAMFLLYLEDRGIIEAGYIHLHGNSHASKLHELLDSHTPDFFCLLKRLDRDLNGGLFKPNPLWEKHAQSLSGFLQGMWNFDGDQGRLLRLYRFEHIPVELLSEVYDRFLGSEGAKKEQGAYYTPRRLAALVVEQAWETLQKRLDAGHLPRILDPSCGSGIFPALLFQRIADHLPEPSWDDLKQIAEHLHGIDINPTAIRISAFSLCLALLHRADPKELRILMGKGKALPELLGVTLTQGDFFDHPTEIRYDCIIGNPPWGQEKQQTPSTGELWTRRNTYPKPTQRERSWPFIWKILAHLPCDGYLALLLPSTGFFLNDVKESLTRLLSVAQLERLVDLSDLRRSLFKSAIFPTCILLATRAEIKGTYKFAYLCPKADLNATRGDRILLSAGDEHFVYAHTFAANSVSTTQRLMWFSPHERRLLSYLDTLPALQKIPLLETYDARNAYPKGTRPNWGAGLGFQAYHGKGKPIPLPELATLPYVATKKHTPWVQSDITSCASYSDGPASVRWQNYPEGFIAPHIVTRLSIRSDFRLQANYSEHSYSFTKSLMGITVPDSDEGRDNGKFLTALLNSAFAGWFMGALGVGVDRPKFDIADILSLPFPSPEDLSNPKQAEEIRANIIATMDAFIQQAHALQGECLTSSDVFPSNLDTSAIDDLIFAYFGLCPEEITAIKENLTLVRKAAQPVKKGNVPQLWEPSKQGHWNTYCEALSAALNVYMEDHDHAWAEAIGYSQDVVVVQVTYQHTPEGTPSLASTQRSRAKILTDLPHDLLQSLEHSLGGNIYLQRCATVFLEEHILLVKPIQRRFWLASAAQVDADHILDNLLRTAEPERDPA